jgi:glycosyltransferase involved in cell wall biosynthesis
VTDGPPSTSPAGDAGPGAPLFSVLIATRNHEAYIEQTLESVAGQSCADFDLVVVDDGSTDRTAEVAHAWLVRFGARHPRPVSLLRTANGGQSSAFERGFSSCRGRYICLLDSDDRWLPHKLALVEDAVRGDRSAGMIVHPLYVITPDGVRTGDVRPMRARLSEGDVRTQLAATGRHVAPATSGVVIRRDVFAELLPMPTKGFPSGADSYLTFGASLRAPVRVIGEPCGEYRIHADSQYLLRMLSVSGLERSVALQRTILEHFGLAGVAGRNAFFARNVFALEKLRGSSRTARRAFRDLASATWHDAAFGPIARAVLLLFWTACLLAPRFVFRRLWHRFQMRQTGYGRVLRQHVACAQVTRP